MCDVGDRGYCCLGETSGCVFPLPAARVMCCAAWAQLLVIRSKLCDEICREARIQGSSETHTGGTLSGAGPLQHHFLSTQRKREIPVQTIPHTRYQADGSEPLSVIPPSFILFQLATLVPLQQSYQIHVTSLTLHSHSLRSSVNPKGVDYKGVFFSKLKLVSTGYYFAFICLLISCWVK